MQQDPEAMYSAHEIFSGSNYDHVKECEGLMFSSKDRFKDPKSKCVREHAFKLGEDCLRILIRVNCSVSFLKKPKATLICILVEWHKLDQSLLADCSLVHVDFTRVASTFFL